MKIKNNLYTFLKYLTVILLLSFTFYRFRIRTPRAVFLETNSAYFYIYICMFIINMFMLVLILCIHYNIKLVMHDKSYTVIFLRKFHEWIESSYSTVMDYIAEIQGFFCNFIAYMTHYYLLIPINILKYITIIPRIVLIFALFFDVFITEEFKYFYYAIYLLLFTLLSKGILYISVEINNRILQECINSISIKNFENVYESQFNNNVNYDDYTLSITNTQFTSIKEVFKVANTTTKELD